MLFLLFLCQDMKEKVTVTAKVQVVVSAEQRDLLRRTGKAYRDACNRISQHVFDTEEENFYNLNRTLYHELRDRFGLKAQMAQSALKAVIAKYRTVRSNGHERTLVRFRMHRYDLVWNRDWSIGEDIVSVNTLDGRIKIPYVKAGMEKYLDRATCRYGTANLVLRDDGKCFLHIPVTYEVDVPDRTDVVNVVGIDRGIRKLAVAYDGAKTTTWSGRSIKSKRAQFARTRKELQQRQTPSARRRLKAIGHRENGWMRDVNHRVSKALVGSNPQGTLFVLEDLTGIRGATERVRTKDRYVTVSWSYYDLEQKLAYKASLAGQKVVRVSPEYTSQRCPVCGAIDRHSRDKSNHVYKCSHCGYRSDDDRIGAMNLYQLGLEYLKGVESPKIQSPSGKPGDGGCRQSPCDATPRRKAKKGRSYGKERNACTTGQSQAHQSSADG